MANFQALDRLLHQDLRLQRLAAGRPADGVTHVSLRRRATGSEEQRDQILT